MGVGSGVGCDHNDNRLLLRLSEKKRVKVLLASVAASVAALATASVSALVPESAAASSASAMKTNKLNFQF